LRRNWLRCTVEPVAEIVPNTQPFFRKTHASLLLLNASSRRNLTALNHRSARFYRLTKAGRRQLEAETRAWEQTTAQIERFFAVKAKDLP
jgi:hypothetical protein